MICVNVEQGSPEWFALRAGIPTASNFDKIITSKGEPSKQAQKYMYQLAGERILGTCEQGYTNHHMERGKIVEEEARQYYELVNDVLVEQVGLCYKNDKRRFSCSPDGIIGSQGGLEIKCPTIAVHVEYLKGNKLPTTYFQQVQGSLYVCEVDYWDFLSYYPGLKKLEIRIDPDFKFHRMLESRLNEFCDQLDELVKEIA